MMMHDDDREYYRSTCDNGAAELLLPPNLTKEEVCDLESWMTLILRRLKRNAFRASETPDTKASEAVEAREAQ